MIFFGLSTYMTLQQCISTSEEGRHFRGTQRIFWHRFSHQERGKYKKLQGKAVVKPKEQIKNRRAKPFASPREAFNLPQSAKLNIASLLKESPDPYLYEIALRLLGQLYLPTIIYKEEMKSKVLDRLIQAAKSISGTLTWEKLFDAINEEREFYLKIFKGTQNYQLCTNIGYPALSDFFCIEENRAPILIMHASRPLLAAAFGEAAAHRMILAEKEAWQSAEDSYLKKEKVEEILSQCMPKNRDPQKLQKLVNFGQHSKKTENLIFYDPQSHIQLKLKKSDPDQSK